MNQATELKKQLAEKIKFDQMNSLVISGQELQSEVDSLTGA